MEQSAQSFVSGGYQVLHEKYEQSLEKWSNKLGKAKKDINLYRMESMEAKLEGDMFIEDVIDGIQRMELLKRQIDARFNDSGSKVALIAKFEDQMTNLYSNSECAILNRGAIEDLYTAFTAYKSEYASSIALLAAQAQAAEAAIKKHEKEHINRDMYIKKVSNLWQHDLSKQSAELSRTRKKLSGVECEFDSYRSEKEQQVAAMRQELLNLKTEITSIKNSQHSADVIDGSGKNVLNRKLDSEGICRDESTDEETENASSRSDHEYELLAMRKELMSLKKELCAYLSSDVDIKPGDKKNGEFSAGHVDGSSNDIYFQVSSHLTSNKRDRSTPAATNTSNTELAQNEMDLQEIVKKFRNQQKLQSDQLLSLQQQVAGLKEELRFKQSEVKHLQASLTEKNTELKDNQRNMQRTMESLRTQINLMQSNLQTQQQQRSPSPSGPSGSSSVDQHNAESLSKVCRCIPQLVPTRLSRIYLLYHIFH
jgi:hypothetical protein